MKDLKQELIKFLIDISDIDSRYNFGIVRERASKLLDLINSDAQAESPTVGDNEDKRLKCDICGRHPNVIIITEFGTYCKEHARYV